LTLSATAGSRRSQHDLLITRLYGCRDLVIGDQCCGDEPDQGTIMAKRKKGSKIQKRGKLPRGKSAKRGKAPKVSKAAKETKRSGAKTKPKRAPVKKVARKVKQPVASAVETARVEVIERPVAVTEIVETEVREVPDEPEARQA
jgi:hypothetical protein